jgi:hypothetical protein
LHHQSLWCAANIDLAREVFQLKVLELDLLNLERDLVTVADFLMNDKADIDSKGFTGVRHGYLRFGVQDCPRGCSGSSAS